jgi:hypothetical protein
MKINEVLKPKTKAEIVDGLNRLKPNEKLIQCASNGYMEGVKEALSNNADINYKLKNGDTALDLAIFNGHSDVYDYLLQQGAWISDISLGYSMKDTDLFDQLLYGLPSDFWNRQNLSWTIEIAIHEGRPEIIEKIENKIRSEGRLTAEDNIYFRKLKLEADNFTKFFM